MSRQTRHPLLLRTKNMATAYQNLSEYDFNSVPDGSEVTVGIVVAEWNTPNAPALAMTPVRALIPAAATGQT